MLLKKYICDLILVLTLIFTFIVLLNGESENISNVFEDEMDIIVSKLFHVSDTHRKPRDVNQCQPVLYKNVTHTRYQAYSVSPPVLPLVEIHHMLREFTDNWAKQQMHIHHQVINNPLTTWSVLEPGQRGSCRNDSGDRFTVLESSLQKNCIVAANAGFFNTHTGQCLGNVVSDEFMVQESGGIQNVHFGITKDGYIFTGYLSELDLIIEDFSQLVGGVVWVVRDGVNYVDESMKLECSEAQETGALEKFVTVMSARTAVGHDKQGKIHMIQVDGKTNLYGINLHQFADLLIELGLYNAINLDGGGSATTVINGTVVNFPSDHCINSSYNCERKVSTIICAHQPQCPVKDCSGHGTCDLGNCHCRGHWSGSGCETLSCPNACSAQGLCTEDGCICNPGWIGVNCSLSCGYGLYGDNCSLPCLCENGALCNAVTGACHCLPGYKGRYCQEVCPLGFYGQDCSQVCICEQSCFCHPQTGSCNATLPSTKYSKAVHCLAEQEIKRLHLMPDREYQYSLCMTSVICLSVIASASFLLNVLLTYFLVKARQNYKSRFSKKVKRVMKRVQRHSDWGRKVEKPNEDREDFNFKYTNFTGAYADRLEDDGAKTGSGDEEEDLFLAPKK